VKGSVEPCVAGVAVGALACAPGDFIFCGLGFAVDGGVYWSRAAVGELPPAQAPPASGPKATTEQTTRAQAVSPSRRAALS
jgi:hypothetical protein